MSESASEIIALLPVPIGAPLVVALVVALIFRFVNPALRSAAHDDRMPFPKAVQWAYGAFVMGTIATILFLIGLTLYRLLQ